MYDELNDWPVEEEDRDHHEEHSTKPEYWGEQKDQPTIFLRDLTGRAIVVQALVQCTDLLNAKWEPELISSPVECPGIENRNDRQYDQ